MYKPMFAGCGLVAGLAFAATALAADLNKSSEGWIYFHRTGATPAAHGAAVGYCTALARQMGTTGGSVTGVIGGVITGLQHATATAPNVENCMISTGWEVVRLDDAEGLNISRLDQKGQAEALAPWVGSQTVHGTAVRRFEPLRDIGRGEVPLSGLLGNQRPALSVTATPSVPILQARQWKNHTLKPDLDPAKVPPGSAFIVIRIAMSAVPNQTYNMVHFDDATLNAYWFSVASPHTWHPKPGDYFEATYVLAVPPGRWNYWGPWGLSLCLGSPGLDIAAGEVLFLGSFTAGSKDPFAPDMNLEPALADLKDADLKQRLRPARWINGYRYDCNPLSYINYPYRVDFPGFPSMPDNPPPPQ